MRDALNAKVLTAVALSGITSTSHNLGSHSSLRAMNAGADFEPDGLIGHRFFVRDDWGRIRLGAERPFILADRTKVGEPCTVCLIVS